VRTKKLNAHVAGVLSDEVDHSHADDHCYRGCEPRGGRASVAKNLGFVV
jgi:hypothetical protein